MYDNKLDSMTRAVSALEDKYSSLVNTYGTDLAVSLRQARTQARVAIDTLKGLNVAKGDINPWLRALADDGYLEQAWLPLAEQTDSTMSQALGFESKYDVTNFFVAGYHNIEEALPSSAETLGGLSIIAVIVVAFAAIVVFK